LTANRQGGFIAAMLPQTPDVKTAKWSADSRIGRYHLVAKLATGGMAEIWLARQFGLQGFEKIVVVKRILDSFAADPTFVHMFLDEARIAAQLNHHHIVQVYDLGYEAAAYYIAMEYLPGESLSTVIRECNHRRQTVPAGHAARLIAEAAEGLAYAHEKRDLAGDPLGIVHRDISPQNLFVSYEGALKILDFGIAKAAGRATRTATGFMKGKLIYASPEQVRGLDVDARSDIFSLGVVFYECLTGKRLFEQTDPTQTLRMLLHDTGPLVRADAPEPGVPPELMAIVSRALERDRDLRFESARAMQSAIEEWLRGLVNAPNPADIADFMRSLFAERIQAQQNLLQSAVAGALGETVRIVQGEVPDRPKETAQARPQSASGRGNRALRMAFIAAGLLGVALAAFLVRSYTQLPLLPVVSRPSPVPASPLPRPAETPEQVALVHVDLESKPPGAQVFNGEKLLGETPLALEWKKGERLDAHFRLSGYADESRAVVPQRDYEMDVTLSRSDPPKPDNVPEPTPAAKPDPKSKRKPMAANALPAPVASGQTGLLTLRSEPWCDAFLDDVPLGATPIVRVAVPSGLHRVLLRNDTAGVRKEITLVVKPGEELKQSVAFPMGKIAVRVEPWAAVTLDGKSIGTTPIEPTEVAAGRHELRLTNPQLGKDEKRLVTVKQGAEQVVKVSWQ
jgi:eukaryotic-like serine/threonine-protein kinase